MPLRLKSLELHGYKTFAARTSFEFSEGITAIVGPNGSGKSNIADALRWVLGEQSYSLLRAKKTEDMIFAGSEQRPRSGMASAGVTFDNSNNWLPVDFSEVALSRRAYRDGRNEYLLNSQHVRLKDINELLAQSGLSERTYTILGQGLVDASLALKADDRRRLFEEAAGIGLYRTRREEALRRLEDAQRNLDRVLDILAELEPRLKSLERQAGRANEYSRLQADLRVLLLEWYGYHWHRAQRELKDANELSHQQEAKLEEMRRCYQNVRQEFAAHRDQLNGLRGRLNSWHRQSAQLHESRESASRNLAMLEERQRSLLDNRQKAINDQSVLGEEIRINKERLAEVEAETTRLQAEHDDAEIQKQAAQSALEERQTENAEKERKIQSKRQKLDDLTQVKANYEARLYSLAIQIDELKQKKASASDAIVTAENQTMIVNQTLKEAASGRQGAEEVLRKAEETLLQNQRRLSDLEAQIKEKQSSRAKALADQARCKAQLDVLDQAEETLTVYSEGARLLLEAARNSKLRGTRGALSSQLDVPAELEVAIAAALGEYTDAVLLTSGDETEQALSMLDSDPSGRASLLPLDQLSPFEPLKGNNDPDCLGVAAELVSAPAELRPAVDLLLGEVLIVRDRQAAKRILAGQSRNTRAVTIRGEVFFATGQVLAGRQNKTAGLGRPRVRRELQSLHSKLENQITTLEAVLSKLTGQAVTAGEEVTRCQEAVNWERKNLELARSREQEATVQADGAERQWEWQVSQKTTLEAEILQAENERQQTEKLLLDSSSEITNAQETLRAEMAELAGLSVDEFQEQLAYWSTQSAVTTRAFSDAMSKKREREETVKRLHNQQTDLQNRSAEIEKSLTELEAHRQELNNQTAGINSQLAELRNLIDPTETDLENASTKEQELQRQETEGQMALARVERTYNQIQLDLGRKQEMLENLRHKIEDDFGLVAFEYATDVSGPVPLPFDGMVEQLPVITELPADLEENMTRLRAQLRRIGSINPEAQQEYQAVKERHAFLTTQVEDLRKAEADLHQIIAELDELTRHEFQKTFDAVAEQFHTTFYRLFGGGSARLLLTDPENLTETGIEIEARLPGRREQGLSLLSGGERSLTAIALVFSLLKVSPTPVCVMDEVDAMLDEANVGRFRELLLELSKQTQFIIITHNRNTVQAADIIYGVTMGRDSASQIISLKLDEVSEDYLK
jgi:chromosome segregation protein